MAVPSCYDNHERSTIFGVRNRVPALHVLLTDGIACRCSRVPTGIAFLILDTTDHWQDRCTGISVQIQETLSPRLLTNVCVGGNTRMRQIGRGMPVPMVAPSDHGFEPSSVEESTLMSMTRVEKWSMYPQ